MSDDVKTKDRSVRDDPDTVVDTTEDGNDVDDGNDGMGEDVDDGDIVVDVDDVRDKKDDSVSRRSDYFKVIKVVPPDQRITSSVMTLFEFSEVVGIRTQQIENDSPEFTDNTGLVSARDRAINELFNRRSPLKIIRKIGDHLQEEWSCNEMGFPHGVRLQFNSRTNRVDSVK
jgi:DNA-directed RNA polymerase subunit K/omega